MHRDDAPHRRLASLPWLLAGLWAASDPWRMTMRRIPFYPLLPIS
jgi:hypothetical protein